jgi:hypothetical protein
MRYRVSCQGVSSYGSAFANEHELPAVHGDAVDGEEQLVHAGDQGDLGQLAARAAFGSGRATKGCNEPR